MTDPIVFISHNRVRDGKLDGFRGFFREGAGFLEGIGVDIYGTPSDEALSMMRSFATALALTVPGARERMPTREAIDRALC